MESKAQKTINVSTFTGGLVGPSIPMLGPVADGGIILAETAPGCWGPMITPSFHLLDLSHLVDLPVRCHLLLLLVPVVQLGLEVLGGLLVPVAPLHSSE